MKIQFRKYFNVGEAAHIDFLTRFLFLSVVSFIIIFLGLPIYGTTDDNILAGFVDGSYSGEREKRLIFIRPLIGYILYLLQGTLPSVGIYATFLTLILILTLSIFGTMIFTALNNQQSKNLFQFSWYAISFVTIVWFTLIPTYTATSILVTAMTLMTVTLCIFIPSNKNYVLTPIILGCLFSCGFLIRPEGALGALAVSIGIVVYFGFKFKKVNVQSLLLIISTIFVFILLDNFLQIISSNGEWEKYDSWNGLRHQVQHRVSQNYLGNIRDQINWTVPEYHLFMDLAFGDEKVFNYQWLKPGFESTNFTRGITGTLNVNFAENIVKILNLISKYYYLVLLQLIITIIYFFRSDLCLKEKIIIVSLVWAPLLSSLYYMIATLHTPDRGIFPLLILPIIFLMTLLPSLSVENQSRRTNKYRLSIGLFAVIISFTIGSNLINTIKYNINEKNQAKILKNELNEFSNEGLFLGPGNTEIYETRNPFMGKAQWESPKMITVGNWDTFSPYWYKRNKRFGISEVPIYAGLFRVNVYWLSNPAPDTSYLIELFLREKGQNSLSRQNVLELQSGQRLFKFEN